MINTEAALKQQIVSNVNTDYLMGLRDKDNVFSGVLSWMIVDYLYTNYGNIEYKDLFANNHCLTYPF